MNSYKPVTSAVRVLEVLGGVAHFKGTATVGDLHHKTGIDKATVVRMLETLIQSGFVMRNTTSATYAITGKTLTLSASYDQHKVIANAVQPIFDQFQDEIGWPADIAVFDQTEMMLIASSYDQDHPMSFKRDPGYRGPVLATGVGLAYIAHCDAQEREDFLTKACKQRLDWCELACDRVQLAAVLDEVRRKGYACGAPEFLAQVFSVQVASIGVPIQHNGRVFAAIGAMYLRQFMTLEQAESSLLPRLQNASCAMGKALARHCV